MIGRINGYFWGRVALFLFIFFALCWIDDFFCIWRLKKIGENIQGQLTYIEILSKTLFISQYFFATLFVYLALFLKNKVVSISILIVFWIFITIDLVCHFIYGRPADLNNISMLNAAVANYSDAVSMYLPEIIKAIFRTSIFFVPCILMCFYRKWFYIKGSKFFFCFSFLALLGIFLVILLFKGVQALNGFPKGFNYLFSTIVIELNNRISPRLFVSTTPNAFYHELGKDIKNIIVVVDESIEFSYFAKNMNLTDSSNIQSFGRSYSAANCSASSNYIIRKAYWLSNNGVLSDMRETDSLFTLAKKHAFKVVYIDNQNVLKDKTVRNYITNDELESIDVIIEGSGPAWSRDIGSLSKLEELIKQEGRHFIFINKVGAHFPYQNAIDPNLVSSHKIVNYERALRSSSIGFIKQLSKMIDNRSIVFYTSDHGQNFFAKSSHCNSAEMAIKEEFSVPFVIISKNTKLNKAIKKEALTNKTNHLIFSESIRNVMGEDLMDVSGCFDINNDKYTSAIYGQPFKLLGKLPTSKIYEY